MKNSLEKSSYLNENNNWEDDPNSLPTYKSWLNIGIISYAKEKIIKIIVEEVFIPTLQ